MKHIPEDYTYRRVPEWAQYDLNEAQYFSYCDWLAEYLMNTDFKISPAQIPWAEAFKDRTPEGIVITLADFLGYQIFERDILEMQAREGVPFSVIEKEDREGWEMDFLNDPDVVEPFEDVRITEKQYDQICREVAEKDKIGNMPDHADIPFRPLLAIAVKKCRDMSHAKEIIRLYYNTFSDASSK